MTSTRLATLVFVLTVASGLTFLWLGESFWLSGGGALLVALGSASLIRHFWRESMQVKKDRNAQIKSLLAYAESSRNQSTELLAAMSGISHGVEELTRGVLEHVAQLNIDFDTLRDELEERAGVSERNRERVETQAVGHRDEILSQISGIIGVYSTLDPEIPYPRFGGWAIGGDCARRLIALIMGDKRTSLLEAGSGLSTVLAARALELVGGEGRLYSLEHDTEWLGATRALLEQHRVGHRVELISAPLVDTEVGGTTYKWYDLTRAELPDRVDLVFIDGPPKATGTLAPYPALPVLYDIIVPGGVLLMDDASRPDEREAVERWKTEFPNIQVHYHSDTKGTVEITKSRA